MTAERFPWLLLNFVNLRDWFGFGTKLKEIIFYYVLERKKYIVGLSGTVLIKTLLFGSNSFATNANTNVLNATIEYVLPTKFYLLK